MRNKIDITIDGRIGLRRRNTLIAHDDTKAHIMQTLLDVITQMNTADFCQLYEITISMDLHRDHVKSIEYVHDWLKDGVKAHMHHFVRNPRRQPELKVNCCDVADFVFRQVDKAQIYAGEFSSDTHIAQRQYPTDLKAMNEWLRTLLIANRRSSYKLNFLHVYAKLHTKVQVKNFCVCLKTIVDLWKV